MGKAFTRKKERGTLWVAYVYEIKKRLLHASWALYVGKRNKFTYNYDHISKIVNSFARRELLLTDLEG